MSANRPVNKSKHITQYMHIYVYTAIHIDINFLAV